MSDSDGPIITLERAAELLHCGRTRIFDLLSEGKLVRAPKFGKKTVVFTDAVLALAVAGAEPPAPPPKRRRKSRAKRHGDALRDLKW